MSAISIFQRATASALRLLGEPSVFGGVETRINIEHGVQMTGIGGEDAAYRGDFVANRDVATIDASLNPKAGDTFTQLGGTYRLTQLVEDSAYFKRYVVVRTA